MSTTDKIMRVLFWISLFISLLLASWYAIHNTLHFHTDIARDFLLMEDMVVTHKPSLIGPRSGGIPGVFHGPLWLYMNLPVFFLSGGNPVATAWFWVALTVLSIGVVYLVTKRIANGTSALAASALYAFAIAGSAANFINPFGAVLLSPLFFYLFIRYRNTGRVLHLLGALFTLGLIIQFQMAWGVPILILSLPLIVHTIVKYRKPLHLASFAILGIPLSTFLVFDLRHQFLQMNSVINYLKGTNGDKATMGVWELVQSRISGMLSGMSLYFSQGNNLVLILLTSSFIVLCILYLRDKKTDKKPVLYFLYFYIGFWLLTLLFRGTMWNYYVWPFLPFFTIVVALMMNAVFRKRAPWVFTILFLLLTLLSVHALYPQTKSYFAQHSGLWHFYKTQADDIYKSAPNEFGWYVYSADQYGYSPKYALHYMQKSNEGKRGYEFQKKKTTYLIIFPSDNKYTNEVWWKKDQIKINLEPKSTYSYNGGSYVERYDLSPKDIEVASDPNLIQDLLFR